MPISQPTQPEAWGPWRLEADTLCLVAIDPSNGRWIYEVDLERSLTSAEALDWIFQVAGKGWADDATLAGLVRAIGDVLNPQGSLCGGGAPKTITPEGVALMCEHAANQWPELVYRKDG